MCFSVKLLNTLKFRISSASSALIEALEIPSFKRCSKKPLSISTEQGTRGDIDLTPP